MSAATGTARPPRGSAPDVNPELTDRRAHDPPDLRWPAQLARGADAGRQALLEAHGERVVRITWPRAVGRPRQTLDRLCAAGAPPRVGSRP